MLVKKHNMIKDNDFLVYWWMLIPMLPSNKICWQYKVLKRIWFDHTMQKVTQDSNGSVTFSGRGFNNQKSEDHLTVVLFQNWALFPNNDWCVEFLNYCGAKTFGKVEKIRWSFGFEEYLQDRSKRPIVDLVIKWKDESGEAILIIEAKRKGVAKLLDKDIPSKSIYLKMPSFAKYNRKTVCLLIDETDLIAVRSLIGDDEPILT